MFLFTSPLFVSVISMKCCSFCLSQSALKFTHKRTFLRIIHEGPVKMSQVMATSSVSHSFESDIDHLSKLRDTKRVSSGCLTGIVCELGPSSRDPEIIAAMIQNGMKIAKLNVTRMPREHIGDIINNVRTEALKYSSLMGYYVPLAIALETCGLEVRTGDITGMPGEGHPEGIKLTRGNPITLKYEYAESMKDKFSTEQIIYVSQPTLSTTAFKQLPKHSFVSIDGGKIVLRVKNSKKCANGLDVLECTVDKGGMLGSKKLVTLPEDTVDYSLLSMKDNEDISAVLLRHSIEMVFVSVTNNAERIVAVRKMLANVGRNVKIIAKIENLEGWENIDNILEVADGLLIAREELSARIPLEEVFSVQKAAIASS